MPQKTKFNTLKNNLFTTFLLIITGSLFLNSASFSQSVIDSLKKELNKAPSKEKPKFLNDIARECFFSGNVEECISYAEQSLKLAETAKNNTEVARAYLNLAFANSAMNKLSESDNFAKKALSLATQIKDKSILAETNHLLGIINDQAGNNDKALEHHKKALEIRQQLDDKIGIGKSLNSIGQIYSNKSEFKEAIKYYQQSLKIKNELNDQRGVAILYFNIANCYYYMDNYEDAVENLQKALDIFESMANTEFLAKCYNLYGIVFQKMKNNVKALEYYKKALENFETTGNQTGICDALTNIGITYSINEEHNSAIEYLQKALKIRREIKDKAGIANCLQNIGLSYFRLNNFNKALTYYNEAVLLNLELGNKKELAANYTAIGNIYKSLKSYNNAIEYFYKSIDIAQEVGLLEIKKNAYLFLSQLFKETGQFQVALEYYEKFTATNDSLLNEAMFKQISELETKYETEKNKQQIVLLNKDKELQANKLARQRLAIVFFIIGLVLVLGLVVVILQSLQRKKRDNAIIVGEKAKVEELLLNILPVKVVNDLKEKGSTQPEGFERVSVFFSDIVGFTKASSVMDPDELISELNDMFTAFDDIFSRHQCERIKTIGDAYMAVCGMPVTNENHAENILNAAIDVINYLNDRNSSHKHQWKIRIGINSGKAVGGIVGVRKYLYDVFGDTVNTASRMESNSEVMRINVSENTYNLLKDEYKFSERQPLEVKGKGLMKMYFLEN